MALAFVVGTRRKRGGGCAGAGVCRPAICPLDRVHLFKLLSVLSFTKPSEGKPEHEEENEKKEKELVGSSRMKGTQEDEEESSKVTASSFLQSYPGLFRPAVLLSGEFKALLLFLFLRLFT